MSGPGRFGALGATPAMAASELSAVAGELVLSALLLLSATAAFGVLIAGLRGGRPLRPVLAAGIARWAAQPWRESDAIAVLALALALIAGPVLNAWSGLDAGGGDAPRSVTGLLLGMAAVPVLAAGLCLRRAGLEDRTLSSLVLGPGGTARWRRDLRWGVAGGLALVLPSLALSWASGIGLQLLGIETLPQDALRWFGDPSTRPAIRWLLAAQAVLLAPAIEELFYRGVVFCVLLRARPTPGSVLLLAFLFAVLHLHPQFVAPLFLVGLGFAAGLLLSGSLLTPLIMHVTFNAANLALYAAGRAVT